MNKIINKFRGFSLIELMIVIAIIGILASIGIPAFGDYLVRARVTELVNTGDSIKKMISEYGIVNSGFVVTDDMVAFDKIGVSDPSYRGMMGPVSARTFPANKDMIALRICGDKKNLGIDNGTFGIVFIGEYKNGGVNWECQYVTDTSNPNNSKYAPSSCRKLAPVEACPEPST